MEIKKRYLIGIGVLIGLLIGLIFGAMFSIIGMAHIVGDLKIEMKNTEIKAGFNETAFVYALNETGIMERQWMKMIIFYGIGIAFLIWYGIAWRLMG